MRRPTPPCHAGDHIQAYHPYPAVGRVTGTVEDVRWDSWVNTHRIFVLIDGRFRYDGSQVVETLFHTEHLERVLDCPHQLRTGQQLDLFGAIA